MNIDQIKSHIRDRAYMSGVERDRLRVKSSGEVFTPTDLVRQMIQSLDPHLVQDPDKTILDPSCGDGQFLGEIVIARVSAGASFEQALSRVYGVDLMIDNVDLCRDRLLCGREDLRWIVEQNIQCQDALTYGFQFRAMGPARRQREQQLRKLSQDRRQRLARERAQAQREKRFFHVV